MCCIYSSLQKIADNWQCYEQNFSSLLDWKVERTWEQFFFEWGELWEKLTQENFSSFKGEQTKDVINSTSNNNNGASDGSATTTKQKHQPLYPCINGKNGVMLVGWRLYYNPAYMPFNLAATGSYSSNGDSTQLNLQQNPNAIEEFD
ncbi:MAG: hypothetical protein FJZ58_03500 [Chlamydiae bacterium]|nr:hypothetical protein [Chlamydiota bacterium]